jgi:hypothetical protein
MLEARLESLVILAELLDDTRASLGMIFTDRKRMARTIADDDDYDHEG